MRDWDVAAIVRADYDEDHHPQAQPDAYGEESSGLQPYALYGMAGFFAMPHEGTKGTNGVPDPAKCCPALTGWYNEKGYIFPLTDPRLITKLPSVKNGGAVMYGGKLAQPSFQYFDPDTGSYQLYVAYDFTGTGDAEAPNKSMAIAINVRNKGAETIEIIHGDGMAITMMAGGKNSTVIKNKSGNAYVEVNDDGVILNGTTIAGAPAGGKVLAYGDAVEEIVNTITTAMKAGLKLTLPPDVAETAATTALLPLVLQLKALKTHNLLGT